MFELGILKEFLTPTNYSWFSYVVAVLYLLTGVVLVTFTGALGNREQDTFKCDFPPDTASNTDYLTAKCYQKYDEQYNSPLPPFGILLISVASMAVVCFIYSCFMRLKTRSRTAPTPNAEDANLATDTRPRRVFRLYLLHLVIRLALMILFTALSFYPSGFPHEFDCESPRKQRRSITDFNITNTWNCHSSVARSKTDVSKWAWGINMIFLFLVLGEIAYLVWRALRENDFTVDSKFCAEYIANQRSKLGFREHLKRTTLQETEKLERIRADEEERTMDDMFVYLELQFRGRSEHTTLNNYDELFHPSETNGNGTKVLIIGPQGTGKSLLCQKLLRDWSKKSHHRFDFAFLFKFGSHNSEATNISLIQLLNPAPQLECERETVIQQLLRNPEKVFLLFDGLPEQRDNEHGEHLRDLYNYQNTSEAVMPVSALYMKLLKGRLLPGATMLTTGRPDVTSRIESKFFDKILDIKEFTKEKVYEFADKYCKQEQGRDSAMAAIMKEHIKNRSPLLSLCYIPVCCHIVCYLLMKEVKREGNPGATNLPTRPNTDFYNKTVTMFISREHPENRDGSFEEGVEKNLSNLGKLARLGVRCERTEFSPKEVQEFNVTTNFGLLKTISDDNGNPYFCFICPVVQNFLAARAIVGSTKLKTNIEEVIEGLKKGNRKWFDVIQFVAGLLGDKHKEVVTESFMACYRESLLSKPSNREVALVMMKCLNEFNDNNLKCTEP